VTDLYAESSGTVTANETVLVAVIDNTTGATLLSCTVNTNMNHCSNTSGSGSAAAGDNIEVKPTATRDFKGAQLSSCLTRGPNCGDDQQWRVTFRY
jgi:hypothetical protein